MHYEKCRKCKYACRCCASHFMDVWPRCSECPNNRIEFSPAVHMSNCPIDGHKIQSPLYDRYGNEYRESRGE